MKRQRLTTPLFIARATAVHEGAYTYERATFQHTKQKLTITCPTHGDFDQIPNAHLRGVGCPVCAKAKRTGGRIPFAEFVLRARTHHGDRYGYDEKYYTKIKDTTKVLCPEHGWVTQNAQHHANGHGCMQCASAKKDGMQKTPEQFLEDARALHGDKYDYTEVVYTNSKTSINIRCPKHGYFQQLPNGHLMGQGCPTCGLGNSESKVEKYLKELTGGRTSRKVIPPKEVDVYVPDRNLAIEYNGTYWHGREKVGRLYHQKKWRQCQDAGVTLLQIWEHDWRQPIKRGILESKIAVLMGRADRIMARKCEVFAVETRFARSFYEQHHLQGAGGVGKNDAHIGLFLNGEVLMSVTARAGEIIRMASKKNTVVVGGATRLLKKLPPGEYHSWILNDTGAVGNHYAELGGAAVRVSPPGYVWAQAKTNGRVLSRHQCQKARLIEQGYDAAKTERQIMEGRGYTQCYNAGSTLYHFTVM